MTLKNGTYSSPPRQAVSPAEAPVVVSVFCVCGAETGYLAQTRIGVSLSGPAAASPAK